MRKRTISLIALLSCLFGLSGVTLAEPYKVVDQGKITCTPSPGPGESCSLDANTYDFTGSTLTVQNKTVPTEKIVIKFDGNNAEGSACFKVTSSGVQSTDASYCQNDKNMYLSFIYKAAIDADKTITFSSFDAVTNMPGAPAPMNHIKITDVGLKLGPEN